MNYAFYVGDDLRNQKAGCFFFLNLMLTAISYVFEEFVEDNREGTAYVKEL